MLIIKATLPTKNLPIRRVLAKLFQSFVYHSLDNKEHTGYKHPNGKVFKAMNFRIVYTENEKTIATKILLDGLKLGEIHISQTELSLQNRHETKRQEIKVGCFVTCAIKD